MALLAVCDLHGRQDWYRWLLWKARRSQVLVIAGDLIDAKQEHLPQIRRLLVWIRELALLEIPVLICSGNHDQVSFPVELADGLSQDVAIEAIRRDCWVDVLGMVNPHCVVSKTRLLLKQNLILTSLPEEGDPSVLEHLMLQGALMRKELAPGSRWIVTRHRPPMGFWAGTGNWSFNFYEHIERFQPDFVFCGHVHEAPIELDRCIDRIGASRIFNPGCHFRRTYPCHASVDPVTRRFTWIR